MRKIKEVLRLRFELGLGQRPIARSCGMGLSTVHEYLERAAAAGVSWPLPEGLGEEELEGKLFGNQPAPARAVRQRPQPDWKAIHEQLQQHRHLTLQLLWEGSMLERDVRDSLAAIDLVLAQPALSSQLIDNFNASSHLRALLTDMFLLGEILRTREKVAVAAEGK